MSRRSLSMQLVMDSSSDDDDDDFLLSVTHVAMNADESDDETRHRGSVLGHRVLRRDRQAGHHRLYQDYFSDDPTYGHSYFRRRYVNNGIIWIIFFINPLYVSHHFLISGFE